MCDACLTDTNKCLTRLNVFVSLSSDLIKTYCSLYLYYSIDFFHFIFIVHLIFYLRYAPTCPGLPGSEKQMLISIDFLVEIRIK